MNDWIVAPAPPAVKCQASHPAGAVEHASALQRRGQELRDALFPLDKADGPSTVLSSAEDRHKLEQLLGMDRGIVADLQTGLTILGPLLASATAAFLSP